MVGWALATAAEVGFDKIFLVVGDESKAIEDALLAGDELEAGAAGSRLPDGTPVEFVVQSPQLGTGHALQVAVPALEAFSSAAEGEVVVTVLYGDMPALSGGALADLHAQRPAAGASLLTARLANPFGYGRVVRDPSGALARIVEERDASSEERTISEVNVGVYAWPLGPLAQQLAALAPNNAQGEYYLTDVAAGLVGDGRPVLPVELEEPGEARGVNTLAELAEARAGVQMRILEGHLAAGVAIEDPATAYVDHGVEIGEGTRILPCTVLRRGVRVGAGCEVGPFTHLREGTVLADGAQVGNFTETKNARLGAGSKAKHLSYLGDVTIGERSNIGAGTIVANYDGRAKHPTTIGDRAFVGSGSILVAPSQVGDDALTGAGAVVTRRAVPKGEAWVGVPAKRLERRGSK